MGLESLVQIKTALSDLNPTNIREMSERRLRIALHAPDDTAYSQMERFFLQGLSAARRSESAALLVRESYGAPQADLDVYHARLPAPSDAVVFHPDEAKRFVNAALSSRGDLGVPLAKYFPPFRQPYIESVINRTSRGNALFSIGTALPDVIPSFIELPWAIAEFASDTAFLTMNQVRMAFLIAGASDREVGYRQQKSEIGAVIGSAFGWRALARQLVGKIPLGGGLIAKAAVAYAGTKVLGISLERFYSIGYTYTREERTRLYSEAFQQGKDIATRFISYVRPDLGARLGR
jgi:hypothetical protein